MNTATKLAGVLVFVVLATANSGGYRYGVSDQAFYLPAVNHHLTPELFPRDAPLLDAQARLITSDELMAAAVKTTGLSLPMVCLLYTSDAAAERSSVDLGGRRTLKKKKKKQNSTECRHNTQDNQTR